MKSIPKKKVVLTRDGNVTMVHTYGLQPIICTDSRMRNVLSLSFHKLTYNKI